MFHSCSENQGKQFSGVVVRCAPKQNSPHNSDLPDNGCDETRTGQQEKQQRELQSARLNHKARLLIVLTCSHCGNEILQPGNLNVVKTYFLPCSRLSLRSKCQLIWYWLRAQPQLLNEALNNVSSHARTKTRGRCFLKSFQKMMNCICERSTLKTRYHLFLHWKMSSDVNSRDMHRVRCLLRLCALLLRLLLKVYTDVQLRNYYLYLRCIYQNCILYKITKLTSAGCKIQ